MDENISMYELASVVICNLVVTAYYKYSKHNYPQLTIKTSRFGITRAKILLTGKLIESSYEMIQKLYMFEKANKVTPVDILTTSGDYFFATLYKVNNPEVELPSELFSMEIDVLIKEG